MKARLASPPSPFRGDRMEKNVLDLTCTGIEDGGIFPAENTGRGSDVSPEFIIRNLSPKAQTIAITLEDLTHPVKNFTHWVIWNIPAAERIDAKIPAGANVPGMSGARQGIGYGFHKYAGPKPPKGKTHTYRFTVYALDCEIELSVHSTKRKFMKKAGGHILQAGSITGSFE